MSNLSDLAEYELKCKPRKSGKKEKERKDSFSFNNGMEILNNNIKNLTDTVGTDSFDLTSKSPKTPSPKKSSKKFLLARLMSAGKKESEKKSSKLCDKRLMSLKFNNSNNVSMLSSPSMFASKKELPCASTSVPNILDFDEDLNETKLDDSFDTMVNGKQNVAENEKKSDETKSDTKSLTIEELPPIKEVSFESPNINSDIINYFKESQSNFRKAMDGIKSINASILEFRRALASEND